MVMRYKNNYVDMLIHQQGQLGLVIYHPKFLKNSNDFFCYLLILKSYCRQKHYHFVPVGIETYGAYGPQALKLIKQIGKKNTGSNQ